MIFLKFEGNGDPLSKSRCHRLHTQAGKPDLPEGTCPNRSGRKNGDQCGLTSFVISDGFCKLESSVGVALINRLCYTKEKKS